MPDDQRVDFLKRGNETSQGIADTHAGLPPDPTGAIMSFNKFIQVCGGVPRADTSAVAPVKTAPPIPGLFFKIPNFSPLNPINPFGINPLHQPTKMALRKNILEVGFSSFLVVF